MKNRLSDLNNHLFSELERLSDEETKGEDLREEIERARAITIVAHKIIENADLVLRAEKYRSDGYIRTEGKYMIGLLDMPENGNEKK